jgi:hypothetical protein
MQQQRAFPAPAYSGYYRGKRIGHGYLEEGIAGKSGILLHKSFLPYHIFNCNTVLWIIFRRKEKKSFISNERKTNALYANMFGEATRNTHRVLRVN